MVALKQPAFEDDDRLGALLDLGFACQLIEAFQILEAVALFGNRQRLTDDREEIDQDLAAEKFVDFILARAVQLRQTSKRRLLVAGVMVDVHPRVTATAIGNKIDESFEGKLLCPAVGPPEGSKLRRLVWHPAAEEILQPAPGFEERVAFHVEKDVTRCGFRQRSQAKRGFVAEQLVNRLQRAARPHLQRRLSPQLCKGLRAHSHRTSVARLRGKLADAMDTGGFEFSDLIAPHPRDQTQVIVVAPLAFAVVFPWTNAAMLALERIFLRPADLTKFGAFGETQKNRLQMTIVR